MKYSLNGYVVHIADRTFNKKIKYGREREDMKTCGYCETEYDDKENQCPNCGSMKLKTKKGRTPEDELERIKEEIERKRKNRSMILGVGVGVILLILIIGVSSISGFINDPQRAINKESKKSYKTAVQYVKEGQYEEAIGILDGINEEWKDYEKVVSKHLEAEKGKLLKLVDKYEAEADYGAILVYISENMENISGDSEIQQIYEEAEQKYKDNVFESVEECVSANDFVSAESILVEASQILDGDENVEKRLYELGKQEVLAKVQEYESEKDYAGAVTYIRENVADVSRDSEIKATYENSVKKYKTDVLEKTEEYVKAGDYSAAKSVLNTCKKIIGTDSEIDKKLSEVGKKEILAKVQEYESAEDYAGAITLINDNMNIIGTDSEILIKLSACEDSFRNQIINNAQNVYDENGCEAAIDEINKGLAVLKEDEEFLKEKATYEEMRPVKLASLSPYVGGLDYTKNNLVYYDNMGNMYSDCFYAYNNSVGRYDYAVYDIGMKYNVLKATVAVTKKGSNDQLGYIKIYGDQQLLWEDRALSITTKPYSIEVDVSGVTDLRIEMNGIWGHPDVGDSKVLLANATLEKTK